ncbi:DNA-binding protein [Microbacterium sp. Marseille-Q6965]|uniref:DNA-binding protein n=1 Tax=Microbacterium sp. Marseille-Q6965 TaxID=2965072 RepID=UPI0021B7CBC6|nr:DNA-binding protein [Microbacterium sp. Marseille-Q6965]
MFVITADQRRSQAGPDLVPAGIDIVTATAGDALALAPERTAGDEIQALLSDAGRTLAAVLALCRTRQWRVGVGVGAVESTPTAQVRAARGPAFVHARDAVERARRSPTRVAVTGHQPRGGGGADDVEALLRLLVELRDRRSDEGWEVHDLLAEGLSQREIARRLRITESAVSRRAGAAALRTEEAAIPALARLLAALDDAS